MNFRAVLALPKTASSAQTHKSRVSFELFGVLGIYNFAAIPKNLGVGVNFRPCSEGYFLSGRP